MYFKQFLDERYLASRLDGMPRDCSLALICRSGARSILFQHVLREEEKQRKRNQLRNKERMTYEQFLHAIDDQKQGALRVSVGLATNFADVYRLMQFASSFVDRWAPPSAGEETSLAPLAERSFTRVCACGYRDSRFEKRFCPHCGRPMPAVVHPSTKESSQDRLNFQGLAEQSSRSVRGLLAHVGEGSLRDR